MTKNHQTLIMIFQKWILLIYRLQKNLEFTQKFPNGISKFWIIVQDDVAQEKEIIEAETEQNKEFFGKDTGVSNLNLWRSGKKM